jgi:tetratricopeptide (TPR) repeat protein
MLSVATRAATRRMPLATQVGIALLFAVALGIAFAQLHSVTPAVTTAAVERMADRRAPGERAVEEAQQRLARAPQDPRAMTRLAGAYLLRQRETGDPGYYTRAEDLLDRAYALQPEEYETLVLLSSLAASRHAFDDALGWGERAVAAGPERPAAFGVVVDALVELGRYEEAVAAAQRMVDLRPDQPSLSRVSYLRELHGDLDGAMDAMRQAIQAGAPEGEGTAWIEVHLGHLLFAQGRLDEAERAYESSLQRRPGYVYGTAGLARVRAARGDLAGAATLYQEAAAAMPIPELVIALGDLYERMGDQERAHQQFALVGAMQRLLAANGVRTDLDLALFNADHDLDLEWALESARSEYAWRKSVQAADTLAWVEYRIGLLEEVVEHSTEALRLGTRDPLMLYRAGVIAEAAGDVERAMELLGNSAALNPEYSVRYAPDLARRLSGDQAGPKRGGEDGR